MSNSSTIRRNQCQWIIKENKKETTFCGCTNLHKHSSYCTEHYSLAFMLPEESEILLKQLVDSIFAEKKDVL